MTDETVEQLYVAACETGQKLKAAWELVAETEHRMPRWASRITLLVEAVRVERLHDISEADAIAEGGRTELGLWTHDLDHYWFYSPLTSFQNVWFSIHGLRVWDANPWVSVTTFRILEVSDLVILQA